jgi:choline transport protein
MEGASSSSSSALDYGQETAHKTTAVSEAREMTDFDRISEADSGTYDYHDIVRNARGEADDGYTRHDKKDMKRMGKAQELRRNFRGLSTLAFVVILQGTWEVLLAASTQGMVDGGLAGLFWSYIWTFAGFSLVVISLAEMASMAPTSGGQYRRPLHYEEGKSLQLTACRLGV